MYGTIFHRAVILHAIIITILLFLNLQTTKATTDNLMSDSMSRDTSNLIIHGANHNRNHFAQSRWVQSTHIGVPLIIGGLIVKHQDDQFRSLRNDFMPSFHHTFDNYTQSLPLSNQFSLGTKMLLDHTWYPKTQAGSFTIPHNNGWGFGTGISISKKIESHFGASLFLDYDLRPPHGLSSKEYLHIMTLGARAYIRF